MSTSQSIQMIDSLDKACNSTRSFEIKDRRSQEYGYTFELMVVFPEAVSYSIKRHGSFHLRGVVVPSSWQPRQVKENKHGNWHGGIESLINQIDSVSFPFPYLSEQCWLISRSLTSSSKRTRYLSSPQAAVRFSGLLNYESAGHLPNTWPWTWRKECFQGSRLQARQMCGKSGPNFEFPGTCI